MRSSTELLDGGDNPVRQARRQMKDLADRPEDIGHGSLVAIGVGLLGNQLVDPSIRLKRLPEKFSQRDSGAANTLVRCFQPELQFLEVASDRPLLGGWIHVKQVRRLASSVVEIDDALANTPQVFTQRHGPPPTTTPAASPHEPRSPPMSSGADRSGRPRGTAQ